MTELKSWGRGTNKVLKGALVIWIVGSVIGLVMLLVVLVMLLNL